MPWKAVICLFFLTISGLCPSLIASKELDQNLRRIFGSKAFTAKFFGPARWIRNGAAYTTLEPSIGVPGATDIVEYDTATGKRSVLVSASQLKPQNTEKPLNVEDYRWDNSGNRLLIFTASQKVWRTNTRGDYWLLDRSASSLKKLGGDSPASSLMFAKFSLDGSRVAYVRANNLYVEDPATGAVTALTSNGSDTLVNGASDWVYEEELNLRDGFRWSPNGQSIAFWQFDQSGVQQFTIINNTEAQYPKLITFPYPKVGTKNSAVRIGVVSAKGGTPRWMQVPGDPREHYIFRLDWLDNHLVIGQLNRKQNTATVFVADPMTGVAKALFTDKDEAWVSVPEDAGFLPDVESFRWLKDRKHFLWLSERDGWNRAYSVSFESGEPVPVTAAATDVIKLEGADPESRWLYFIASPDNPLQRYLYRSPLGHPGPPIRLTPTDLSGTNTYDISPDKRWAFHSYSRMDRPTTTDLVSLPEHKTVRVLEGNEALRTNVAGFLGSPAEFLKLPISDGVTLDGYLIKPQSFDPTKKYPLLVHVYGEPASTTVVDRWGGSGFLFHHALANDGYLVASFDNRGTPAPKGRAWRKAIYGAVGVLSSREQTEAVFALAKQRAYLDLSRVGVWGWSGGGTNTLNLMFRSPDLFRVGVAVAPVPDQKLYDTIYQERYMGLPDENAQGYQAGSAINFAEGLQGKLLIVHGSGDDNVHFQGTQKLINRLVELGKPFDFMEYPNRSHSISEGQGTSLHVYSLIARYIEEHLPAGPQ